jgi:hypothetical protein
LNLKLRSHESLLLETNLGVNSLLYWAREGAYLKDELHLARLELVHLCLLQHLIVGGITCLSDVDYLPREIYILIKFLPETMQIMLRRDLLLVRG